MPDLHPTRYFSASLNTLKIGAADDFTVVEYSEDEQETLEEAAELIERLQNEYLDRQR